VLNKALQKGLYFEIEAHQLLDLKSDSDDDPNIVLENFHDSFYKSNLSSFANTLDDGLMQMLFFYYTYLQLAVVYQDKLFKINRKIEEVTNAKEKMKLSEKRGDILSVLRDILVPCQFIRKEKLLPELRKGFKVDPAKVEFIDALHTHKKWFDERMNLLEKSGNP
jgi:hypothetical protein